MPEHTDTMPLNTMPPDILPSPRGGNMIAATLSCPQPNTTVCTVTGKVDLATAPLLADTLTDAVHDNRSHLVIDLSAVALLDSAGWQAVLEALDRYGIDGHLAVVVDSNSAATPADVTALDKFLDVHDDLTGALQACAQAAISTAGRHRAKIMD